MMMMRRGGYKGKREREGGYVCVIVRLLKKVSIFDIHSRE